MDMPIRPAETAIKRESSKGRREARERKEVMFFVKKNQKTFTY
jgi:hypothetical protein